MDALVVLFLIIWFFLSFAKKANQVKKKGGAGRTGPAQTEAPKKQAPRPAPIARPAPSGEGVSGGYVPMQTHMQQLLQEQREAEGQKREYVGSLGGGSMEGEDACDPSLGHEKRQETPGAPAVANAPGPAIGLSFDTSAVVNGLIMSEILAKPSQRKWGRIG